MLRLKLSTGIALTALIAVLGVTSIALAHTQAATSTTVTVKATEFKFRLSTNRARHGVFIFKVTNKGHVKHDFKIAGKKTPLIAPGKSATLRVTLTKGPHKYICTVIGHAAAGMKGTFRAT
jgi:nitrite reductase (NO-forming)